MRKILYSLAISSLLFGCKESKDEEMQPKNDGVITITSNQFESMGIQIDTPKERSFDVNCKTSGKIDVPPQNRAQVTTFIGGYVKSTRLLVGDKVRK
jgi:cobalt-zinc-cadmium efflux system membrane fusion protein